MAISETKRETFGTPQDACRSVDRNVLRVRTVQGGASSKVLPDPNLSFNRTDRQFRHCRNTNGGIESICTRCGALLAWTDDEWLLLDHEHRHVCRKE
jgi:hypothetical protein